MTRFFLSLLLVLAIPAFSQNTHFFVVCGYEDGFNTPGNSHIFARFMELEGGFDGNTGKGIKSLDISWLPQDFPQTLSLGFWLFSTPGKNYSFEESLELAKRVGSKVKCSEVIPTTEKNYLLAKERIELLNSGRIRYQALVPFEHKNAVGKDARGATNCIYSIADLHPYFDHGTTHGWKSATLVTEYLSENGFRDKTAKKNEALEKWVHAMISPYAPNSYLP